MIIPFSKVALGRSYFRPCIMAAMIAVTSLPAYAQTADNPLSEDQWNICNETSFVLRLAVATIKKGKMVPRGWESVRPGACISKTPPKNSGRYVYAESERFHAGRVHEWKGTINLCVDADDFEADATVSCALQDMDERAYLQVDPTERTTTFIEPDNFGENADTAGLQRLLRDNGYKISRIDGLPGRRTSSTLAKFLKDKELGKSLTTGQKFGALVKSATEIQASIGLTLCNKSSQTIWSAIAYQRDGEWESRGWWPILAEGCARPFTSTLKNTNAHYFALQEQPVDADIDSAKAPKDKRLRTVAAKPRRFCVAEGVFSAIGDEYCADRGYTPVSFRPLPTDAPGATVNLSDADFALPSATGLRR